MGQPLDQVIKKGLQALVRWEVLASEVPLVPLVPEPRGAPLEPVAGRPARHSQCLDQAREKAIDSGRDWDPLMTWADSFTTNS